VLRGRLSLCLENSPRGGQFIANMIIKGNGRRPLFVVMFVCGVLCVLAGAGLWEIDRRATATSPRTLPLIAQGYDFGQLTSSFAGQLRFSLKFVSESKDPVRVTGVTAGCGCLEIVPYAGIVSPGGVAEVKGFLDTAKMKIGSQSFAVTLWSDAKRVGEATVRYAYEPHYAAEPAAVGVDFVEGYAAPQTVTVVLRDLRTGKISNAASDLVPKFLPGKGMQLVTVDFARRMDGVGYDFRVVPRTQLPPGSHLVTFGATTTGKLEDAVFFEIRLNVASAIRIEPAGLIVSKAEALQGWRRRVEVQVKVPTLPVQASGGTLQCRWLGPAPGNPNPAPLLPNQPLPPVSVGYLEIEGPAVTEAQANARLGEVSRVSLSGRVATGAEVKQDISITYSP
jgi:hypothetical protein